MHFLFGQHKVHKRTTFILNAKCIFMPLLLVSSRGLSFTPVNPPAYVYVCSEKGFRSINLVNFNSKDLKLDDMLFWANTYRSSSKMVCFTFVVLELCPLK